MKTAGLILNTLLASTAVAANAEELQGSAYSILFRSDAPASTRAPARPAYPYNRAYPPPQTVPSGPSGPYSLFASSIQKVVAQAHYDPRLKGYFFKLPMNLEFPPGPVCLVLKDARGTSVPVRDERKGDDGYAFHNAMWEAEQGRGRDLAAQRASLRALLSERDSAQTEIGAAAAEPVEPAGCVAPPQPPEPPRPASALSDEEARALAGGICARKWVDRLGSVQAAELLYRDAGLAGDWAARDRAEAAARAFTALRIDISDEDLERIKAGARRGIGYLEHDEGVHRLKEKTGICKAEVPKQAASAGQRWETAKQAARDAPALAVLACQSKLARVAELRRGLSNSVERERELRQRIDRLEKSEPGASDTARIDGASCKEF